MKGAAMMLVLPAMLLMPLAGLFTPGEAACDKVPTMTWKEACDKTSQTPDMYDLCAKTLQNEPDNADKVSVYAATAATAAWRSYEVTTAAAESQLKNASSIPTYEAIVLQNCATQTAWARVRMSAVARDMARCDFTYTVVEYEEASTAVHNCSDNLVAYPRWPLAAMNLADRGITYVAHALGNLALRRPFAN